MEFIVKDLLDVDKQQVLKGFCPWCIVRLFDNTLSGGEGDMCPECFDIFK